MLDFTEKLLSLLVSPYSYIAIRTWEDDRTIRAIRALAEQQRRSVLEWAPDDRPGGGLLEALDALAEAASPGSIAVLRDAHPYLGDPRVVHKLRLQEARMAANRECMVFISPFFDLPPELVKDVTFLDAPLPGRIELDAVLEDVLPPDVWPTLPRERVVSAALGLTLREARRAFSRARFEHQQARRKGIADFDLEAAVVAEKRRLIEADRILEYLELERDLTDVGGLDALKAWLAERRGAFTQAAADFGLPAPRGLLLTGVQGCGKSLFAKAVAGFWGIPLVRLDTTRLFDGSIPPEAALRRAIQTAEALSPAVLWIDEIDKAFADAAGGPVSRMMGSLLSWLQDKTRPVFFVATANRVAALPPELLRKGRFDEIFFVDLPAKVDRTEILRIHVSRRGREPAAFDLDALAERTLHFSGAELEQVVVAALFKAFAQERELAQVDLEAAAAETVPLFRTYESEIKALREWAQGRARPATRDRTLLELFNKQRDPKVSP